jgi:DNA modification methylase
LGAVDTQPAVLIIDTFMGCGSTALAARMCKCKFIGMDRDIKCVDAAKKLFADLKDSPVPHNTIPHVYIYRLNICFFASLYFRL